MLWGAADQGVYGLTNLALAVVVATSVDRQSFGAFSVVLIIYTITIGSVQGLVSEVFTVTHGSEASGGVEPSLAEAAGCSLALGFLVGAVAFAVGAWASGPVAALLPAFAVVVPAMYVQDTWRFALFALGRPRDAFLNDMAWAVVQVAAFVLLKLTHHDTVRAFILAWGAGALAGAILGTMQTRTIPQPWAAWSWIRQHWSLGGRFAGEFLTLFGSAQLVLAAVAAGAGLAELARLRAAQVLFAPLQGLLNAVRLAVTSVAVQVWATTPRRLGRFSTWLAVALGAAALASAAVAIALPDRIGRKVLGSSWSGVGPLLAPVGLLNVILAVSLGAVTAMRAMRASRASLRARTIMAVLIVVVGSVGAVVAGAGGAAWGLVGAAAVGLVVIVLVTRKTLQLQLAGSPDRSTP